MNLNNCIFSERNTTGLLWYHVVFDWEDEIAKNLGLSIYPLSLPYTEDRKLTVLREVKSILDPFRVKYNQWNVAFVMYPRISHRYRKMDVIPVYLDIPAKWVSKIAWETRKLPIYFVTSMDAYNALHAKKGNNNCIYLPLSIPDKYYQKSLPKKDIDVIQIGRKSSKLHEFMMKYCESHPNVNYVYRDKTGYISSQGKLIGDAPTREDYMSLLGRARVSLVSSPAMDEDKDFGGFDFFTPRFFESIVQYCHLIGRYHENDEAQFFSIKEICPNVRNYEEFVNLLEEKLGRDNAQNVQDYEWFIKKNLTSTRAIEMKSKLKEAGLIFLLENDREMGK